VLHSVAVLAPVRDKNHSFCRAQGSAGAGFVDEFPNAPLQSS
jgi:hypothetical protein